MPFRADCTAHDHAAVDMARQRKTAAVGHGTHQVAGSRGQAVRATFDLCVPGAATALQHQHAHVLRLHACMLSIYEIVSMVLHAVALLQT